MTHGVDIRTHEFLQKRMREIGCLDDDRRHRYSGGTRFRVADITVGTKLADELFSTSWFRLALGRYDIPGVLQVLEHILDIRAEFLGGWAK